MIWRSLALAGLVLIALGVVAARAADCPGNPNALGTSRVLSIDPKDYPRIGTVQYSRSLPLEDKEVVLTFDDGPLPPYTNRVLDVLAEHCVKATYFIIGRMARGYPDLLKRIRADGHTIGNHSQNHPLAFEKMPLNLVQAEIEQGFASIAQALGERRPPSPFFRIPGLLRANEVENYLQSRGLTTWSADAVADDWKHINASEVVRRSIARLDEKGKGILLLHDIQPATALALPELLRELKAKGYRIVHVVPRGMPQRDIPVAAVPTPREPEVLASAAKEPRQQETRQPETRQQEVRPQEMRREEPVAARQQLAPPEPVAVAAVAAAPVRVQPEPEPRMEPVEAPQAAPEANASAVVVVAPAEDSLARAIPIVPGNPIRPFTSEGKPARSMPTPGKFVTTEPGGWPPVVSIPMAKAGGVGVSSVSRGSAGPDGRFR
jgi:peptidoglycan/xylan/chitin deacetylase (PgdA/CDA1 family)